MSHRAFARRILLLSAILLGTTAPSLQSVAAELIKVPDGVVVRSLFAWEETNGLEVALDQGIFAASRTRSGADFDLSQADLCQSPAYRLLTAAGAMPFVDLSHLCATDEDDSVTFALIADTQELHDQHQRTAELLAKLADQFPEIKFVVTAGDIVDKGTEEQWRTYRTVASSQYTYKLPIVPVLGNHEYYDDPELKFFNRVYKTAKTAKGYYVLDLGPAVLIVLNSNNDQMTAEENATQTRWLARTLRKYAGVKPMMATYHHPAYSSGVANLYMPGPPAYVKANWLPLFTQFGVKLVLNGHEHVYERLLIEGVNYLNAGPAGGKLGYTKPIRSRYSQAMLKNIRTVSIVKVNKSGNISLRTYSPDRDDELVDEIDF